MTLLDPDTAAKMKAEWEEEIATALSDPKIKASLDTLIEEGIEPSVAHGCLMRLRRQTQHN